MRKRIVTLAGTFLPVLFILTFGGNFQNAPWEVPVRYKKMENPLKGDPESFEVGKALYRKHCRSCHGVEGLGDGTKAAELKTPCGDFTSNEFQVQSDGAIFFKTYEGRSDMPGFSKEIPAAEDIWSIVNYLRSLK